MLWYFGRRLLLFVPTLLIISLVAFGLSRLAPGDPIQCGTQDLLEHGLGANSYESARTRYREEARRKGLDKPPFYLAIRPAAYPDTLYRILERYQRQTLRKLIDQYGNWPQIQAYAQRLEDWERQLYQLPRERSRDAQIRLERDLRLLKLSYRQERVESYFVKMQALIEADSLLREDLGPAWQALREAYTQILDEATPERLLQPALHWYGTDNQYHFWLFNFLRGDFGYSCRNGQAGADRLGGALWWTFIMSLPAILLSYLIAVPIGIRAATRRDSWFDRISTLILFLLYSLPSFWVATLLIVFVTTAEYGAWLDLFPTSGVGELPDEAPFWARLGERAHHLILPVFCMTYASLSFISRQMRTGVLYVLGQDFIRTAHAKGLPPRRVVWRHVFRNALFPLITLVALILPGVISGSVIVELIFNIPGMGRETISAIQARDWPVVYTILMLSAILTLLGNLLADLLYTLADPRVSYD